jgi:TonB-dependent receptor
MARKSKFKLNPISAAVSAALLIGSAETTVAQEVLEEIVVTGIRASFRNSMNIKRDSVGVVDAITSEDIGKFPDTNLAESLQRISGVSIDRQNGEGSQVTVRGFGPGFNLITLNGRTLPTAEVSITGARDNFTGGQGRSFDFSNIASEGISGLEVYKTGQSLLPSGGIGATINIQTHRPLDLPGTHATFGVKGVADSSVSEGDDITPELSGLFSWNNDEETIGVGLFGGYSKRDSGAAIGQTNDWVVRRAADFFSDTSLVRAGGDPSNYTNAPADGELFAIPQDSRYDFSDLTRERLNGQLVVQFRPMDALMLTADYTYARSDSEEQRLEQTNWFATPFDQIVFDGTGPFSAAQFMQENNDGTKDMGFEQTYRATSDEIDSFGFNAVWDVNDNSSLRFDAHVSSAESVPDNPLGHTATFVTFAAPVIQQHQVDFSSGFPVQQFGINDSAKGNADGVLNVQDLGSQVSRSSSQWQTMDVNEFDLRYTMGSEDNRLDFGVNFRDTEVFVKARTTQQDLGTWGVANARDIEQFAPGVVEEFCLACEFDDFPVGEAQTAFKADATQLYSILTPIYANAGNGVTVNDTENTVEEDILAFYAQFQMESEFLGLPMRVNAGLRYEQTDVTSNALQSVPTQIVWTADNDFVIQFSPNLEPVGPAKGDYNHLLPNIDVRLDVTNDVVARLSYSQTIGRVPYGDLFAVTEAGAPNRPTVLGGQTGGDARDPSLLPLESENFDISVEWYYSDASYVSVGFFDKTVQNFLGTGVFNQPLFDLRDPTAGAPGSRSGDALVVIDDLGIDRSEANLFTLVALIDDNGGDVAAARAEFESNLVNGALPQTYVDAILGQFDVVGDANDPLMEFRVTQPINDQEGNIHGWEISWQHFFSDSGFGLAANYTYVDGDVEADIASDPNENQFALVGLSDTANFSVIYEKYGVSARVAYNWRDAFLNETNVGGSRSPQFTDEHGQIDASISYAINDNLQLLFEGINLNSEDHRQYRRKEMMVSWAYELEPRYTFGARYRFQ